MILLFILIIIGLIKFVLWSLKPTIYTNPKDYQYLKEKIVEQNKIKHFPDKIPENATDIHFKGYTDMPYNGELILLNFKIDKSYIENELKKNDFWNKSDKLGQKQNIYFVPKVTDDFNENDYTYYVIKDDDNKDYYKKFFPYFSGIGVNISDNKILYYYILPAD